ncbi:HEXXH motif-containing putative peptide modification protein [Streptomyces sp. NPDC048272]|uniref:aKG-HExxH-type peptide beta-hydroxylase n=1 Tax=Streptomyces sp. NPDC048272 TaxID=3154616 RepID=UPI00341E8152
MLTLYGTDEVIRNVYRLSRGERKQPVTTTGELRDQYLDFLSGDRFKAPVNLGAEIFIKDPETERQLAAAYSGGILNDLDQTNVIGDSFDTEVRDRKIATARSALAELLTLNEDIAVVFPLVIHSVFLKQTNRLDNGSAAHGGSSSNAIGSIWLSLNDTLTQNDVMELFIHELTHHLLFIDEYSHNHFVYEEIGKKENYALSAIRGTHRPLDKVIHSIVVATELVTARERYLGHGGSELEVHPESHKILEDTLASCASVLALENLEKLVSDRAIDFVKSCASRCESLQAA